jgi:hypothetical protein
MVSRLADDVAADGAYTKVGELQSKLQLSVLHGASLFCHDQASVGGIPCLAKGC